MTNFTDIIQKALQKGDAGNASFRARIYKRARTILLQKNTDLGNIPETQRMLGELDAAIEQIEIGYVQLESVEIPGNLTVDVKPSLVQRSSNAIDTKTPKRTPKSLFAAITGFIGIAMAYLFWTSGPDLTAIDGFNATGKKTPIAITVSKTVQVDGDATIIDAGGQLFIIDNSEDKIQYYQWIMNDIASEAEHDVSLSLGKDLSRKALLQIQIVYSAQGKKSKIYMYVIDLSNGKVYPKGDTAVPDYKMQLLADNWVFGVKTKNFNSKSNMQLIISPNVGPVKTGSIVVGSIAIADS